MAVTIERLESPGYIKFGKIQALFIVRRRGDEAAGCSFELRDHLIELFPDRADSIRDCFKTCRETGSEFAEELVASAALTPEEWFVALGRLEPRPRAGKRGWATRLASAFRRNGGDN